MIPKAQMTEVKVENWTTTKNTIGARDTAHG
jgi:hypothetical protein